MGNGFKIYFSKQEQQEIAEQAVQLFRERVIGDIQTIVVESIESPFLAAEESEIESFPLTPDGHPKSDILQMSGKGRTTINVLHVVRVAIFNALLTKDTELSFLEGGLILTEELITKVGDYAINIINAKLSTIELDEPMSQRLIEYKQLSEKNFHELRQQSVDAMMEYYSLNDAKARRGLFLRIHHILEDIAKANTNYKRYFSYFIGTTSDDSDDDKQKVYAGAPQGEREDSTLDSELLDSSENWKFGEEEGANSGIPATFHATLYVPESELRLIGFLPEFIRAFDIFRKKSLFPWEGRDTGSPEDQNIKKIPIRYKGYLGQILWRQLILYTYASNGLNQLGAQGSRSAIPGKPISGNVELRKCITLLKKDIVHTLEKMRAIDERDIAEVERIHGVLKGKMDDRNQALRIFFENPKRRAELVQPILSVMEEIDQIRQGDGSVQFENMEESELGDDCAHIESLLGDHTFPAHVPPTISAPLSDVENFLMDNNRNNEQYSKWSDLRQTPGSLIFQLPPESSTQSPEFLNHLGTFLGTIIVRKMMIYFSTYIRTKVGDIDTGTCLIGLRYEIEQLMTVATSLERRMQWGHNPEIKFDGLQYEIEMLESVLFHTLQEYIATERIDQLFIAQKIQNLLKAIDQRKEEQEKIGQVQRKGNRQVDIPKMSPKEKKLSKYLPHHFREEYPALFQKVVHFDYDKKLSEDENRELGERESYKHACQRAMFIYFFAQEQAYTLGRLILDTPEEFTPEVLTHMCQEEKEIRQSLPNLLRDIAHTLTCIKPIPHVNEDDYNRAYLLARKTFTQIDAQQAYIVGPGSPKIREYWGIIQSTLTYFCQELEKDAHQKYVHKFATLQKECRQRCEKITELINKYLRSFLSDLIQDTTAADEMIVYLEDVMSTFFIPKSGEKNED